MEKHEARNGNFIRPEAPVNHAGNSINAMVHVHTLNSPPPAPSQMDEAAGKSVVLESLLERIARHGAAAERAAEDCLEELQERFAAILYAQLHKAGITLNDKLSITLSEEQTLILQSSEDSGAILDALAADSELQSLLVRLQKLAVTARGIRYLNAVASDDARSCAQYAACFKGALSHFYLK